MAQRNVDDPPASLGPYGPGTYHILKYSALALGLAAMMAMTVPTLRADWSPWLATCLWCCFGFFVAELALKLWQGAHTGHVMGYLLSGTGAIDILAIVPVPLALFAGVPPDTAWLFAALWVFKLAAAVPGLSMLGRIVSLEARPLASVFIIFLIILLLAGVALHLLERAAQPDRFGSLPMSLWWAVTTLSTTGYGDAVPETFFGRMVAGAVMVCGLAVFGLLTGILATGFAAEHRRREFIRNWDLVTGVPFLRNLDAPAIIELTRMLRRLDLPERSIVVRRGRPGDCMYFIAHGEVEVKVEPQPVRLGPGSFFGEFALLDGGPRSATVTTTMASTLLVLDVTDFRAFTAHHPALAQAVEMESAKRKTDVKAAPPAQP
ncbi:MAG: cyclic nucleotide-gated ion channel [Pseudolabrys sp.]|nr:cyclic nucleotide-gated ion channel [Pseudolabrys sp.]